MPLYVIHLPLLLLASFTGILHLDHFDAGGASACSIYNSYVVITGDLNSLRGRWFSRHWEVHWPHPSIRFGEMQPTHHLVDWLGAVIIIQDLRMEPPFLKIRRGIKWNFTMPYLHVQSVCGKGYEQRGGGTIWTNWTLWAEIVWNDHLVEVTVTPSVKPSSSHPVVVKLCPDRDCHSNAIYATIMQVSQFSLLSNFTLF